MRCWIAMLAIVLTAAAGVQGQRQEVLVSAAASLADVLNRIAQVYEKRTGTRVVVNTGASNALARQIAAGAAVDLFISADATQMDAVRGEIVANTRIVLLSNQLAIAVPSDRPRSVRSARDLLAPAFRRIAIGDPAAVPAGVYAKAYFDMLGIWNAVSAKVIPSASVRLALKAVETGAADAAIVYRTDLIGSRGAALAMAIPIADGPRIVYPAAVIRGGRNRESAMRLLAWLRSTEAGAIFTGAGFLRAD